MKVFLLSASFHFAYVIAGERIGWSVAAIVESRLTGAPTLRVYIVYHIDRQLQVRTPS